jgi:hypothetical protein
MKFILVSADTLGEKYFSGNKTFHPSSPLPLGRLPFFAVSPLYGKIGARPPLFFQVPQCLDALRNGSGRKACVRRFLFPYPPAVWVKAVLA